MKKNALESILSFRALPMLLLLLLIAGSLSSCELFDKHKQPEPTPVPEPAPKPTPTPNPTPTPTPTPGPESDDGPRTPVPDQLVGSWADGSFDFELWENYPEGRWAGRDAVAVREAMVFQKNGDAKYYRYEKTYPIDEELVDCTGTVTFNDDGSFTFYPKAGRKRYYARLNSVKVDRPLTDTELTYPKIAGKRAYKYISSVNPPQIEIRVPYSAPYKWYKLK